MAHDGLDLQQGEQSLTLVIRREGRRNAMSRRMWQALPEVLARCVGQAPVLVITGHGGDFCAGADVREFGDSSVDEVNGFFADMQRAITAVARLPIPTVAAVEGFALGAGLLLALACDVRVAGRGVRMGMPVARFGITVSPGFIAPLVRAVGPDQARMLLLTGRLCRTLEAWNTGMVHRLVGKGEARATAEAMAAQMAGYAPASLRAARAATEGVDLTSGRFVDPEEFPDRVTAFLRTDPARR